MWLRASYQAGKFFDQTKNRYEPPDNPIQQNEYKITDLNKENFTMNTKNIKDMTNT